MRVLWTYALAASALIGAACGSDNTDAAITSGAAEQISGEITVFAAASLTAAYTEMGEAFMAKHPDVKVTFSFAASTDLATQINEGAPADVFAPADEATMNKVTGKGDGEPQIAATTSLQIIVGPGNPKGIAAIADLGRPDVIYVTCAPGVPIGTYAAQILTAGGVTTRPASLEANVKGIVTKVTTGEADAGIVYTTDVIAAGSDAEGIVIPADLNVIARFPIVVTRSAPNPATARAFVAFVLSDEGQQILAGHGFTTRDRVG